jgi:hypothetical protein
MKHLLSALSVLLTLLPTLVLAQLTGSVLDDAGQPLPYANIYVSQTNIGTASNTDGSYALDLPPGDHTIIYQYVGYTSERRVINIGNDPIVVDVTLRPESIEVAAVTIAADAEDPAYGIMRKVIAKRDYHRNLIKAFTADIYIKGLVKMTDAPEKIMGQEVGNLNGLLDTSRQGVLYLSETRSKIDYSAGGEFRETVYAKRTSGSNDGIDFNNLRFAWFDFYKERLPFERDIISPLADEAFTFYRFRLDGTFYDEDGNEVNKIEVTPKDSYRPTVFGYLYIVENDWNIHSLDLKFTGRSQKRQFIDTVTIKQNHVPVPGSTDRARYLINQSLDFGSSLLGFRIHGAFTYVFTDFLPKDAIVKKRKAEVLTVLEGAEKDSIYWKQNRPIPLTEEEVAGYYKRDSLKVLQSSRPYLDSIDRANNKLTIRNLLLGHTHSNSYKKYQIYNSGLAQKLSFNAVEGIKAGNQTTFTYDNEETGRRTVASTNVYYGFADRRWKAYGSLYHRYNPKEYGWWRLSGGRRYQQVDRQNPIPPISNTLRSLLDKQHLSKVFSNTGVSLATGRELLNGLFGSVRVGYAHRTPLDNATDWSLGNRDATFEPNDIGVARDRSSHYELGLVWYPGIKYMSYPTRKTWIGSKWPRVELTFTQAVAIWDVADQAEYQQIELNIRDSDVALGIWGSLRYNLTLGTFIDNTYLNRVDRRHFLTNDININWDERYFSQFKSMPYYTYDTDEGYAMLIAEHNLNGLLMDKVPLLRDLGARTVIGGGHLSTTDRSYSEVSIGLDGFKLFDFNLLRLDYIWSWDGGDFLDQGFVITLRNPLF